MQDIPALLAPIVENLKKEGIDLNQNEVEVKSSYSSFEEKAIRAVHEAWQQASLLPDKQGDLSEAARIVEKIQVAAAEAERAAFITHTLKAKKCSQMAQRIAVLCRELLHELQEKRMSKKVA